jgi:hypothetical protein
MEKASRQQGGQLMKGLVLGIVIPAVVFAISFIMTELLFRHFSKKGEKGLPDKQARSGS